MQILHCGPKNVTFSQYTAYFYNIWHTVHWVNLQHNNYWFICLIHILLPHNIGKIFFQLDNVPAYHVHSIRWSSYCSMKLWMFIPPSSEYRLWGIMQNMEHHAELCIRCQFKKWLTLTRGSSSLVLNATCYWHMARDFTPMWIKKGAILNTCCDRLFRLQCRLVMWIKWYV